MALSTDVVVRACERVFVRVCDLGKDVPSGTPAAGFLAGAARKMDQAQRRLERAAGPEDLAEALRLLGRASSLLGDVAVLSDAHPVDGLDRISVIVDGLCVTLEIDQRDLDRSARRDEGHV